LTADNHDKIARLERDFDTTSFIVNRRH